LAQPFAENSERQMSEQHDGDGGKIMSKQAQPFTPENAILWLEAQAKHFDEQMHFLEADAYRAIVATIEQLRSARPEALRKEPDPLTLELADELFGCFLHRAAPDADHSWECAVCELPVTMPNWITSKHAEDCAVAKARDYLAQHAPQRTPGYTPSPLAEKRGG
jgi:hypothetical protein